MKEELAGAFNQWAAYYFSWSDKPLQREIGIAEDAWEAGWIAALNYIKRSESQNE